MLVADAPGTQQLGKYVRVREGVPAGTLWTTKIMIQIQEDGPGDVVPSIF